MKIYAYTTPTYPEGAIKVGETAGDVTARILSDLGTPNVPYTLLWQASGCEPNGTPIRDKRVHDVLRRMGKTQLESVHANRRKPEVFFCSLDDVKTAFTALATGRELDAGRHRTYALRDEQAAAVDITAAAFSETTPTVANPAPRFLWNAKMRFGQTFTTYQLAARLGLTRILVLTYKPAVAESWRSDLLGHVDFQGWRFHERTNKSLPDMDDPSPLVWFASFQDVLGKTPEGRVKAHNRTLVGTDWDLVVFDEYHYGAWREGAQELFSQTAGDGDDRDGPEHDIAAEDVENRIRGCRFLYLSGTPFQALSTGEFDDNRIFNWTYPQEQRKKAELQAAGNGPNPYESLPELQLRTYLLSDLALEEATQGTTNTFSLSQLFRASTHTVDGTTEHRFLEETYVEAFLRTITGRNQLLHSEHLRTNRRLSAAQFPYADPNLRQELRHTLWYLPNVAACRAMASLLRKDEFFRSTYRIVDIGGDAAPTGADAIRPVRDAIDHQDAKPTITLTCGKLTTGVTVPEWTGIFMLRALSKPESYFQAAFRVQSSWTTPDPLADSGECIQKSRCFVFDFDPQRALRLAGDMAISLSPHSKTTPEAKVADFTTFLPIFCFDGDALLPVNAAEVLTIAEAGMTSSMMIKRWKSAALVKLNTDAFEALLSDDELVAALGNLDQFSKVDIRSTAKLVISSNHALKRAKNEARKPSASEDAEEKEARKKKERLQEALLGFLQRIPVFMYVTDARESALIDVIQEDEGRRFERATGLSLSMFERLRETGILNDRRIDHAILSFRQYEEASLAYAGNAKDRSVLLGGVSKVFDADDQSALLNSSPAAGRRSPRPAPTPAFFARRQVQHPTVARNAAHTGGD